MSYQDKFEKALAKLERVESQETGKNPAVFYCLVGYYVLFVAVAFPSFLRRHN